MTTQIRDTIKYLKYQYSTLTNPMQGNTIFLKFKLFYTPHTALKIGYHCDSEVIDKKLFIVNFNGFVKNIGGDIRQLSLMDFIDDDSSMIFASWFNGEFACFLDYELSSDINLQLLVFKNGELSEVKEISRRNYFKNLVN